MSSRNQTKILIKELFNYKNHPSIYHINKKITKNNISSIELRMERKNNLKINIDKNIINTNNMIQSNKMKNNKQLSIPNISLLNKTPEKDEKQYYAYVKENYSAQQNKKINIPDISKHIRQSSNKINMLPLMLKNDYKTLKLNTNIKETINKPEKTDRQESTKRDIKSIPSINYSQIENRSEVENKMNKDIKSNVNINIINYNKICIKKELKPIKIINKLNLLDNKKKNENGELKKLKHFMKDRFYIDTENKMNKKLKDKVFSHDHSLRDKIIEMNQIGEFWGGIIDYCNPVFSIKRFGYLKKKLNQIKNKRNNSEGTKNFELLSEKQKVNKNNLRSMRLFTINSYLEYKHQKKLETKKEFYEKYNDSSKYYIL